MEYAQHDISSKSIAFLDIVAFEEGKAFRGGILITDLNTYPLEFRITSPIRPTTLQMILYGRTLKSYIYTELVTIPLLRAIKSRPEFVFVTSELLLNARPKVHLPIFYIAKKDEGPKIKSHPKYKNELQVAHSVLRDLDYNLLIEVFSRIKAALHEAHRQKIGEN